MFESIISIVASIAIWYLAQVAIYLFASLNIFWTFRKEGYAIPVFKNGVLSKMILGYTGNHFARALPSDAPEDIDNLNIYNIEVAPNAEAAQSPLSWLYDLIFPIKGIAWVGIPGFCELGEKISVKNEVCELQFKKAELVNKIPYNIDARLTFRVINPAKAIARIDDYKKATLDRVHDWLELEFRSLKEEDFKTRKAGEPSSLDDVFTRVLALTDELTHRYGVVVHGIDIGDIDPADENLRNITLKKTVAEATAAAAFAEEEGRSKVALKKAETDADVMKKMATAEAEAMGIKNKAAKEMCDNALRLKELYAIEHAGANVTIIGNGLAIPAVLPLSTQKGA